MTEAVSPFMRRMLAQRAEREYLQSQRELNAKYDEIGRMFRARLYGPPPPVVMESAVRNVIDARKKQASGEMPTVHEIPLEIQDMH